MTLRRIAALLAAFGLTVGLFGAGISATYTDSATAQFSQLFTGHFECQLDSTTPGAIVSADKHSVTYADPEIQVSDPPQGGNDNGGLSVTVKNTGNMTEKLHWTVVGPGYNPSDAPYNAPPYNTIHTWPDGHTSGTFGTANAPADTDPFAPGASLTYTGLGFMWLTPLTNSDLGATVTATYHVDCTEHVVSASHISYVGVNSATVALAPATTVAAGSNNVWTWTGPQGQLAWGIGTQGAGVLNVVSTAAFAATGPWTVSVATTLGVAPYATPATVTCTGKTATSFTGCTTTAGGGMMTTGKAVTGPSPSVALPAGWLPGDLAVLLTGDGSSSLVGTGFTTVNSTVQNHSRLATRVLVAGDGPIAITGGAGDAEVAVYRGATGIGANTYGNTGSGLPPESPNYPLYCSALSLTKIDGSSWVGCMTHDTRTTSVTNQMVFSKVLTTTPVPPTLDGLITTNRSGGLSDIHMGLADTNGGVAAWSNGSLPMGGWVEPISSITHTTETYAFELLSQ